MCRVGATRKMDERVWGWGAYETKDGKEEERRAVGSSWVRVGIALEGCEQGSLFNWVGNRQTYAGAAG